MSNLDGVREALKESWYDLRDVLVDCGLFVERRAADGDEEAVELAERLSAARLYLGLENFRGRQELEKEKQQ